MKNTSVNKQKRFPLIAVLRACIQLISFIIMPALFITIFSSIGELWHAAFSGTFSLDAYGWKIVLLLAVFGTTIIFGRFFCGFVCSFGAMQDLLWQIQRIQERLVDVVEIVARIASALYRCSRLGLRTV